MSQLFLILSFIIISVVNGNETPIVKTKLGLVRGSNMTTDYGKSFYAFRAVPFAKPPVNNLRFMPPEPTDSWEGIFDATEDGNNCLQFDTVIQKIIGEEDCLHLNIYSAELTNSTLRPVMVFIHGGAFTFGSSTSTAFGPERLLDKDIVLVTINYRLAALGFLCTQDAVSPGNYGMLDQVLALKWIQENIVNFGGDPNSVTIFGESAGAASVSFHVVSPQSKGLFHAAIHESGTATQGWALQSAPINLTVQLAESLQCSTNSSVEIIECLRNLKAVAIVNAAKGRQFVPVVDASFRTVPFLPDNPTVLLQNDKFNKVPSIIGINRNEGFLFLLTTAIQYGTLIDQFTLEEFINYTMMEMPLNKTADMWRTLAEEYFTNFNLTNATQLVEVYTNLFSDINFNCFTDLTIEIMSSKGVPVYSYDVTYQGEHSIIDTVPQGPVDYLKLLGIVTHTDEQPYLFRTGSPNPNVTTLNDEDRKISNLMLSLWTNFAANKVPTLSESGTDDPTFQWTPTNATNPSYLDIDSTKPFMKNGYLCTRPDLWKRFIKNQFLV